MLKPHIFHILLWGRREQTRVEWTVQQVPEGVRSGNNSVQFSFLLGRKRRRKKKINYLQQKILSKFKGLFNSSILLRIYGTKHKSGLKRTIVECMVIPCKQS